MIPDYNDLYDAYDREQARREERLPHCEYCGNAIHEKYYVVGGVKVCPDCLEDLFAHYVEDELD